MTPFDGSGTRLDVSARYCYLTTRGRRTDHAHVTELWFVTRGASVFLLARRGDACDWLRNLTDRGHGRIAVGPTGHWTRSDSGRDIDDRELRRRLMEHLLLNPGDSFPVTRRCLQPGNDEESWVRRAFVEKYEMLETYRPRGESLTQWAAAGLAVALEFDLRGGR